MTRRGLRPKLFPTRPRFTQNDLKAMRLCVDMIAAGPWDEGSYGLRPDFENILDKLDDKIKEKAA